MRQNSELDMRLSVLTLGNNVEGHKYKAELNERILKERKKRDRMERRR